MSTGGSDAGTAPEPGWRRDFPIGAAGEEEVTRRDFARFLVLGSGAMAVGNLGLAMWTQLRSINSDRETAIVAADAVGVGETHLFRYPTGSDPAVLLRVDESDFVAFSQKCTHLGCVVYFQAEEDRWHCPCHEGNFEPVSGEVISGPPTRPLGRIEVEVRDDGMVWAVAAHEEHP